ncbi:MAG: hypothetical protein ACYC6C_14555 [Coriobacteriia bacterium]
MPASGWCDDKGDRPPVKFGRKARQWFERKIRAQFKEVLATWGDEDAIALFVTWYVEQIDRYVIWEDADEWRGRGFSNGQWSYRAGAVQRDFDKAEIATDRALDAMRYVSLDEWLEAEAKGWLLGKGEEGGTGRLPEDERKELRIRSISRRIARARNRVCSCGASFIADRRNARRCDTCRKAGARGGRSWKEVSEPPAAPRAEHPLFTMGRLSEAAEMLETLAESIDLNRRIS